MLSNPSEGRSDKSKDLRRECGRWLRQVREDAGLTQLQLAQKLNYGYYTFISQVESGKGRVPPEQYRAWAEAVGLDPSFFVRRLMQYYDPNAYELIYGVDPDLEHGEHR